jgi:hypothetical protein
MDAYIYGERRALPEGFAAYQDRARSAVVSIDMHQGHLADTPDCPCPAPRARELVAPIDRFTTRLAASECRSSMCGPFCAKAASTTSTVSKRHGGWSFHFMGVTSPMKERAGPSS